MKSANRAKIDKETHQERCDSFFKLHMKMYFFNSAFLKAY